MRLTTIALAAGCSIAALGCAPPDDTQEIIDNLVQAGFPRNDIMVVGGVVYVGRDAEVSLAASREMLGTGHTTKEQYRTTNLVSPALAKICIDGSSFTGVFSTALDLAIQNYDEQPLGFAMARTPTAGCSSTITAVLAPGVVGGSSGFPSGGLPFGTINIGDGLAGFPVDTIEHVITHEIGHTIGFRHSDFFDRSISCGGTPFNEGDGGVGAILIPGTPSGAVVGGSIMNSCFRTVETGEFTATDLIALSGLYGSPFSNPSYFTTAYSDPTGWAGAPYYWGTIDYPDLDGDGRADVCGRAGGGIYCSLSTGSGFTAPTFWTTAYSDATGWIGADYYWRTIRFADINGDGKADICGRASGGLYCALSTGSSFTAPTFWTTGYSDAGGWAGAQYYWGTIEFPDLNGDGKADVCGRASGGLYCALSTGSSFTAPTYWTSAYSDPTGWVSADYYWRTIKYADLNGDGKTDVCGRASGGMYCSLSTGGAFTAPTFWTTGYSDAGGWAGAQYYWGTIELPDLDGDGKADVCGRASGGIYCALSTGGSFTPPAYRSSGYSDAGGWAGAQYYWGTIRYPDVNGDGRADVCGRASGGLYCAD
ncbi:MAG: hypothetical protein E6J90_19610 [Deltaproteobacteria bacterium]|nr:MAG: hypothetical protein E6J90_19610 [Deltaproteobacteria bacterium]